MPSRLVLCALLLAAAAGAEEPSEGIDSYMEFGGLMIMADGLNKLQHICTTLFPSQAEVIRGHYDASSVATYVRAFGFEVPPSLRGDRGKLLETLGKSEGELSSRCLEEFPEALKDFDTQYAERAEEWIPAIEKMTAATETFPQPVPLQATPELTNLFEQIQERSNRAYQTGDWSALAEVYEPGTFDCWRGMSGAETFGFLSFEPLSPNATFVVSEYTMYMLEQEVRIQLRRS